MRPVLTTLNFPRRKAWAARVKMLDRTALTSRQLLREILDGSTPDTIVVLDGSVGRQGAYVDRIAAALLSRRRTPPTIVMTDCTWTPGPLRRLALKAIDTERVTFCVLSSSEKLTFPSDWGVRPIQVSVTPFYWTLPDDQPAPRPHGTGFFAGGDSLRDHDTLVQAADRSGLPVRIATRLRAPAALPPNVVWGPLTPTEYLGHLADAAVVVVPMRAGMRRSAGQQTYLNAMVLEKPVIVSDVPGARDHVADGHTGLLVAPGDVDALVRAMQWLTGPGSADDVRAMARRAREAVLVEAHPDAYVRALLRVVDGL